MNTPKKTQIYNLVILDKSGSMESIRTEAINGYNETHWRKAQVHARIRDED